MSGGGGQNPRLDAPHIQYAPPPQRPYANPAIRARPPQPPYPNPAIRAPPPPPLPPYANPAIRAPHPPPPGPHPPPYAGPAFPWPPHYNPAPARPTPLPPQNLPPYSQPAFPHNAAPPPLPPLPPGKRRLEDPEPLGPGRFKRVIGLPDRYIPVSEFFDLYPPTEPYNFKSGSSFGSIPQQVVAPKTTTAGQYVADGLFAYLFSNHAAKKSLGGEFSLEHIFVSLSAPYHVIIQKRANKFATQSNICRDLERAVHTLLLPAYGEEGSRPAYLDDFIARVMRLADPEITNEEWHKRRWLIKNHPFLVRPAKRRSVLEDFYKFYKTLDPQAAVSLFREISGRFYQRWHVLIARNDDFLSTVYWKGREWLCPPDHFNRNYAEREFADEEDPNVFRYTSLHGFLAVFLRHFIVHGPEEEIIWPHGPEMALWYGVELEELDLIIAYYFGQFLAILLGELLEIASRYDLVRELLTVYADRRSAQVAG